jgi:hypothetical protein
MASTSTRSTAPQRDRQRGFANLEELSFVSESLAPTVEGRCADSLPRAILGNALVVVVVAIHEAAPVVDLLLVGHETR